ncbi:MAG TPA: NAD-dependent malic enzyme [Balneolaceae bacterium]|nr:NAD-dependent malic enzyme [Balneolaceae bacterium]
MSEIQPSVSYSFTMRMYIENQPGMLAKVLDAIANEKADPGAVDVVRIEGKFKVRDITVNARDDVHSKKIVEAVKKIDGVQVHNVSDRVFLLHLGGKISIKNKVPIDTRDALSMAYTPGVGRVSEDIAKNKEKAHSLTIKQNAVAVVSDGSAVLGLGNIGPEAAMPVMEGKAMLFKEFADIDAYPICLDTQNADEIVNAVKWISPGFGGINLEDISAPRCFEVEQKLKEELDIPVFHDDQHGTAIVTLAATINALKVVEKKMDNLRVTIVGAGAAGMAITRILINAGVEEILVCNRKGIINNEQDNLDKNLTWIAKNTNADNKRGDLLDATTGADLLIGVSGPGSVSYQAIEAMADAPIVFALANPVPEIMPEEIRSIAPIIATGRSDYPNQINNVLAFPGVFRGALDAEAIDINEEMKLAAAYAIANSIDDNDVGENYIVPSVFNKESAQRVAQKVKEAAIESGVARI